MDNQIPPQSPPQLPVEEAPVATPTLTSIPVSEPPKNNGWIKWVLIILVAVLISSGGTYYVLNSKSQTPSQKACTQEAKQCSDGSYVGRVGPNCEFAVCPNPSPSPIDETANWKIYTNTKLGYSLKYPPDWKLIECPKDCGEDKTNESTGIISPDISNTTSGGYLKYYSIIIDKQKFELPTENSSNEIISNITVTRHMEGGLEGEYVLFKQNDQTVVLNFNPYNKEQSDPNQEKFYVIFNQILSTFKFSQ